MVRITESDLARLHKGGSFPVTPVLKYHNKRVMLDGYTFDSKAEAVRYQELLLIQASKGLTALTVHPEFRLQIGYVEICRYEADFSYYQHGKIVVEDVKGVRTDVYKLKKKLMKAMLGIDVVEITPSRKKWRGK